MKPVTHLHFHTEYSIRDSIIKIEQLPDIIRKKNVKTLALTDHGNVDGAIKFYQKTKDVKLEDGTGFAPLLGCEFYVVDDYKEKKDKYRYHLTVIAKSLKGFQSIMKALTVANLEGFYYRPRIDFSWMLENLEDVVVMTACIDGLFGHPKKYEYMEKFIEKFGNDFYFEVMLLEDYEPYKERNKEIVEAAEAGDIGMAFTNDVHYIEEADWTAREVCFAVHYGKDLDKDTYNIKKAGSTTKVYLKTHDEMVDSLKEFGLERYEEKMVETWDKIVKDCDARNWMKQMPVTVPIAYAEAKKSPENYLRKLCEEEFEKRAMTEVARERMEYELKEICGGTVCFAEYFLLVRDMVLEAKKRDVMVGVGRGTVGASLVAYLLGITGVNPLDYNLMFERFISPGRHDLPDIDLDFEDIKRDEVIEYLRQKYGGDKAALVSTYAAMKGRGAIRDVSRPFRVPLAKVNEASKQILVRSGGDARASFSIEDTMSLFEVSKEFKKEYPHVVEEAQKLEGLLKNKGIHAAGVVVDTDDLYSGRKCVLVKTKQGDVAINWDKYDLEYMGLMKIDVLGLKTLNVLHIIQKMVEKNKGDEINWQELIPWDNKVGEGRREADPEVMRRFREGDSVGVFQFGSAGMIQYLKNFMPKNFKELYQVNALFRPGTLRSGMATQFIQFRKEPEKAKYINDELREILEETYGIVLFQEQIMYILNKLGNIPWRTTDMIRKVVSKSEGQEKFETFRTQFLKGVKELKSMNADDANKIFSLMKFFGSYGFNKSHSVEYTILGYWTMWAKVHYPLEFYCANLMRELDKDNISILLTEINKVGIKIELPDINKSKMTWTIESTEGEGTLRAGFNLIRGISSRLSEEMIRIRESVGGEFESFKQFYDSVPKRLVNIARIKALCLAEAFGGLLTEDEHKKMVVHIEKNRKVPADLEELEKINVEEFDELEITKQDVFNYELAEAFFKENKIFLDEIVERIAARCKGKDGEKMRIDKLDAMKGVGDDKIMGDRWFIGKFDDIKYGYRSAVDKDKESVDTSGYASDLGGVYGIFRDDTYLYYATFRKELYKREDLKPKIEGAAGKYMLVRADKPLRSTNIFIKELHFIDDIKGGDFAEDLRMGGLIQEQKEDYLDIREAVKDCSACGARKYCEQPVPLSCGTTNVMIVGQDPGGVEERKGEPFVGPTGKLLWDSLREVSGYMERDLFYVSNVRKCKPPEGTRDLAVDRICTGLWLKLELDLIKPRLILALGKPAVKYLSGKEKFSVVDLSGVAEWKKNLKAWVLYSIHPAYILHGGGQESEALLDVWKETVLKKFKNMFERLI